MVAKRFLLKHKSDYITPAVKISSDSPQPPPDCLAWHVSLSPFKKWCPFASLALSFMAPSTHLCSCTEPLAFSDLGSYQLLSGMPFPTLFLGKSCAFFSPRLRHLCSQGCSPGRLLLFRVVCASFAFPQHLVHSSFMTFLFLSKTQPY